MRPGATSRKAVVAAVVGAGVGAAAALVAPWQVASLAGWDAGAIVLLVWVWAALRGLDGDETRTVATEEDVSRPVAGLLLLVASVGCLVGVVFALLKATDATTGAGKATLVVVALVSVASSWSVVHTVFALRYADMYYGQVEGGVDFNEDAAPDFVDFAYLAITIGMTYQVSDTNVTSRPIRRVALRHALLSFLFGTFILATTINVVAGLLK